MQTIQAQDLLKGLWDNAPQNMPIESVCTDSREVTENSVFVAIKGERVDGHDYAITALEHGAKAIVMQHAVTGVPAEKTVLVKDPLDAMITMGANYRNQYNPVIIGVTGSVGKTTTKEFCAVVFSAFGETLKNEGNQNNEIGLPKTMFRISESIRYAILEMGMQGLGEIHKLSVAARPQAAVITKIGTSHLEQLGSVENIRKAKMEICDGLEPGAPLVLNADDPMLQTAHIPAHVRAVHVGIDNTAHDINAINVQTAQDGMRFTIMDKQYGEHAVYIPAIGEHNVRNALLAYGAATRLGLHASTAAKALAQYKPADMRQNITQHNGVTLIEDCYNANPDSMRAAIATLKSLPANKRIAVLGDMRELGAISEQAHKELGLWCAQNGIDLLLTVGEMAKDAVQAAQENGVQAFAFDSNSGAAEKLLQSAKTGDAVLVKASRALRFEEILQAFKK